MSLKTADSTGIKILGIGNPFLDRVVHIDALPDGLKKGETSVVFEKKIVEQSWQSAYRGATYSWSLGGSCTNVIKVVAPLLASLGITHSCSLLGMAGKDRKQELEEKLESRGITPLLSEGEDDNGIVNCFVTPDSHRTMQTFFGASLEFTANHISPDHFNKVSHVHLEGYLAYFTDVLEKNITLAKEKGASVSLDLSSVDVIAQFQGRMRQCATKVDIIFGNFQEMEAFTECSEIAKMFEKFDTKQIVVMTDGSRGCQVKCANESAVLPFAALPVEAHKILDTTGAGDFFIAGFLAGFLAKKDVRTCVKIANLAASFVIQQDGADLPEEKWNELKRAVCACK